MLVVQGVAVLPLTKSQRSMWSGVIVARSVASGAEDLTAWTSVAVSTDLGATSDVGVLITDRGLYKPGDVVSLKGYVRQADQMSLSVYMPVADGSVRYNVSVTWRTGGVVAVRSHLPFRCSQRALRCCLTLP